MILNMIDIIAGAHQPPHPSFIVDRFGYSVCRTWARPVPARAPPVCYTAAAGDAGSA
jgi:hypothetical protein